MRLSLLPIAILLLTAAVHAQSWEAVRGIEQRAQIKVHAVGGNYQGRLQTVTPDAVSIETNRGVVSVERTQVRRVEVRSTGRRVRRVAIAAAAGLAAGIAIDLSAGAYFRNELGEGTGARVATYIAPVAIFGGIAGAFPAYRTVYRVP